MIGLSTPNLNGNEARYLQECIESTFVSSVGPFVNRFESMVAEAMGATHAVATSSGTTGLHLALTTLGVQTNDLVIIPSFTFIATANAVAHCGAIPWLVDVARNSWTLDPDLLLSTLKKNTVPHNGVCHHKESGRRIAAIMPVYTLGTPADMDAINAVASSYNIPVVADAAAALGARYRGKNLAALASISVLSFNGNKTVTAGGGGMLIGNDERLLSLARHLSTTARAGTAYDHDRVGFNYRLTNLQAAVGCAQMERFQDFVTAKRRIDAYYRESLKGLPGVAFFPHPDWAESACWFTGIILDDESRMSAADVCRVLREHDVEARPFWKPIHLQRPYAAALHTEMPVSESIWMRIVTLPCSTNITTVELEKVSGVVRSLWK